MRTQVLSATATTPWLQKCSSSLSSAETYPVADFPFVLGRSDECDLPIVSTRISRRHAEILREAGAYRVRDLASTNGTFVNGQKIEVAHLVDGDLLVIADVEFSFHVPATAPSRGVATQVMGGGGQETTGCEENQGLELLRAIRSLQETLLHRGARNKFQPIMDLSTNKPLGYEACDYTWQRLLESPSAPRTLPGIDCRLTQRTQQLHRLVAAEQAARLGEGQLLFLKLQPAEVGADHLPESLARLRQLVPGKRIVAEVPDSAVVDIPFFRDFLEHLRQLSLEVAYDGFAGGGHQIRNQAPYAAEYIKLAPALVRGVDRSTQRQQQIRVLVAAAEEIGSKLIASGVHSAGEAETCLELGCPLAQGDHFGAPQTILWPSEGWGAA